MAAADHTDADAEVADAAAHRDFAVPEPIAGQARDWLALPPAERPVVPPRASATVLVLRDEPRLEVFVLRRAAGMAFAAGMLAFPGGGVDPRDGDEDVRWVGPTPQEWARRLHTDERAARELVTAAAREVFEECGVLLAGPGPDRVVDDLGDPGWGQERARLLDRSQSFAQMLTRRGLVLRSDLLALRGHWVTPECEPRRYDTRFFAARIPPGQVADDASTEAEVAGWWRPEQVLRAHDEGTELVLPPTRVMVEQLLGVEGEDLDAWLTTPVEVAEVLPEPVEQGGRVWMRTTAGTQG